MPTDVEDFLAHYGKKGMKWGERRAAKKAAKAEKLRIDQDEFERKLQKLQSVLSMSVTVIKIGLAIKQHQSIPRRTFVTPVRVTNTPSSEVVKMALNSKGTWTL